MVRESLFLFSILAEKTTLSSFNPTKESVEYVDSIKADVEWLGFKWNAMFYASDYFGKIYEYALKNVPVAIQETIAKAGLDIDDISKILIHQANAKMDYAMINRLFKLYGKDSYSHSIAPMTIQQYGNSSVATVPTMYDLIVKGKMEGHAINSGDHIVFASVGAGMNINAIVYKVP